MKLLWHLEINFLWRKYHQCTLNSIVKLYYIFNIEGDKECDLTMADIRSKMFWELQIKSLSFMTGWHWMLYNVHFFSNRSFLPVYKISSYIIFQWTWLPLDVWILRRKIHDNKYTTWFFANTWIANFSLSNKTLCIRLQKKNNTWKWMTKNIKLRPITIWTK